MPNQINSEIQSSEETKAWLAAWSDNDRYCHYFAIAVDGEEKHLMGNWNAPFYSSEEAKQFQGMMQDKHPDSELVCIEGLMHINGAMANTPNEFWATWQKKHTDRLIALKTVSKIKVTDKGEKA